MNKNYNVELLPEDIIKTMKKNIYYNYLHFTSYSDINKNYLSIRSSLFSLIHKISNKMNFKSNTYFLGIYYLDLILLKNKIPSLYKNNFELLGLTCLVLAAKHLENDPTVPQLQYFVNTYHYIIKQYMHNFQTKNFYEYSHISFNDLLLSEVIVCKMLNYKLNYFTIYDFNSFFFGHGILKIEQLSDITEDLYSLKNDNNLDEDDLNYIDPDMVKRILEKIYKKSRYYLDNVVKNKISLKYDSFLISIYIMHKSVEYVILKENKLLNGGKNQEEYYIEKIDEILKRKTTKCFKDIMNDIYKIDLDSIEEYQYLINDEEFLKVFELAKYSDNKNIKNNNKNEFDVNERLLPERMSKLSKIHRKFQSNNIDSLSKNKFDKSETIEHKKFSPKKVTHMKVPSEKYNKIKRLKILERLNKNTKTSKNKFTKSFILMNSKDEISKNKMNTSINMQNNNIDILSRTKYNSDYNDMFFYNIKNNNKNKTINIDNYNEKIIEPYNQGNKITNKYQNNTSFIKNLNLKDPLITENNYQHFPTLGVERDKSLIKSDLDNIQINKINFNIENNSGKNLININKKINTLNKNDNPSTYIKPYSRKVIPKVEKKTINNQNKNNKLNITNKMTINTSINQTNISFKENQFNNYTSKNYELRSSNANKFKNSLLENSNKLNDSIEKKKEYSTNINASYGRINLNMLKRTKENEISSSKCNNKIKGIKLSINDIKKSGVSVNKIKVNGVSNRHKLNKRLILGMHKTPMKTENYLKNALKRNIGVKRDNNISIINNNNSIDNSFEEPFENRQNNEKKIDNISCLNLNINKIDSNKKVINIKNELNKYDNSSSNIMKDNINRTNELSSSSEEEDYDEENDNKFKLNNIRINQLTEENNDNSFDKIEKNNIKDYNDKKYKNKKMAEKGKNNNKKIPKIELIQINKKKSPTIVINNNINVNFDNKNLNSANQFSKIKKFKIK